MPSATPPSLRKHSQGDAERRHYWIEGQSFPAAVLGAGLHVVATPIGNHGDITLRALATLAAADLILAEDTRVSRRLLTHYSISAPLQAYHEHNATEMRPRVLARLAEGAAVVLISDAGTPLVSDPGYKLVRDAAEEGYRVYPIPGASAVLAGLVAAALPTDRFFFEGFLPPKSGARRTRAEALRAVPGTLVFFETGPRLAASLADLAAVLGERPAAVTRELTKTFEEVRRGTLPSLASAYAEAANPPKGEIVVLVGPPGEEPPPEAEDVDQQLRSALGHLSVKDAAAAIAQTTGLPRRDLYRRALELANAAAER
jgi:16S rRNA (cytidine1402-2'-O)-methyltransferase